MLKARYVIAFAAVMFAALAALPQRAQSWGQFGHLVVCDLAYRNLTETSRAKLKVLFNEGKGGIHVKGKGKDAEDRHYTSFNLGCLEEDERPRKHPRDHFINVSRDTAAITGPACPNDGECIFKGIARDLATLKDESKPKEDRVFALMAIGHWIGDIHQPLHISFADDQGGNDVLARLTGKCGTSDYPVSNLHGVWDSCLLEAGLFERVRQRADFKKTWGPNTITYRAVDTLQARTGHAAEKEMVKSQPYEWAQESYRITLDPETLYCTKVGSTCQYSKDMVTFPEKGKRRVQKLDQKYLAKFKDIAEERVKLGGFRLAHLINLALDPAYTEPVRNSTQGP